MAKYRDSKVTATLMNLNKASASWPVSIELSTICFGSRMVFLTDRELLRWTWQNIGTPRIRLRAGPHSGGTLWVWGFMWLGLTVSLGIS
jgi:hypothetical protein